MSTTNIQSPSSIMILKYNMSFKQIEPLINKWLINHPSESFDTLSKLLRSGQVVLKKKTLSRVPKLSPIEAIKLIEEIKQSGSLKVTDQKYHLKVYKNCFVGSELIDWLKVYKGLITEEALLLGKYLFTLNLIRHTKNEHDFENEYLFYNFTLPKMHIHLSPTETNELLQEIKQSDTFELKNRTFKLINYPQCFLGSGLIEWLKKNKKMTTLEAISVGQELIRNNHIGHVTNDHDFKNEDLFYNFNSTPPLTKFFRI